MTIRSLVKRTCDFLGVPRYLIRYNLAELNLLVVRLYAYSPMQRRTIKRVLGLQSVRLRFGCGPTSCDGWVGIDCIWHHAVDVRLDLRRRLPFPDCSVDCCHSEHFLEHLYPAEVIGHLREVHRVLRRGGVYRVVVPAGFRFVQKYFEGDAEFFAEAFPWAHTPREAVYCILNWNGEHRSIFDAAELATVGAESGFDRVVETQVGKGTQPAVLVDRKDNQRVAESLYVEFIKGG